MKKSLAPLIVLATGILLLSVIVIAQNDSQESHEYSYIGAKKCMMCHKRDGVGSSWLETKHANALSVLKPADREKGSCLECHATGTTPAGKLLPDVQCEACHGPGSEYRDLNTMKNRELAVKRGLIPGDEETCLRCHSIERAPEVCGITEEFDYKEMSVDGIHAMPYSNPQD